MRVWQSRARSTAVVSRLLVKLGFGLGLGGGAMGCNVTPVTGTDPVTDPSAIYQTLTLNTKAVTLHTTAPYNAFQLVATPLDATGAPMAGLPAPTFHVDVPTDTAKVWVAPDGMLTARSTTSGSSIVRVIAELAVSGNLRHADTVQVVVRSTGYQKAGSLSIEPLPPGDSAVVPLRPNDAMIAATVNPFVPTRLVPVARLVDTNGVTITNALVRYYSLDPNIITVGIPGTSSAALRTLVRIRPGQGRVVATATVYGITVADTVVYTVTWPIAQRVENRVSVVGGQAFSPSVDVRIAPYGVIIWHNRVAGDSVDVTFDDTTNVALPPAIITDYFNLANTAVPNLYGPGPHYGTGNVRIPGLPAYAPDGPVPSGWNNLLWTSQVRQFPVPGVYRFHSVKTGASGRIVVTSDPDPTALP